ncbi:MAG: phosphodiester glycosidase family protein [Bacteroidia bacterium]|nr:phosphodiester glycosidase family protein [Bacteroidia bacterium]
MKTYLLLTVLCSLIWLGLVSRPTPSDHRIIDYVIDPRESHLKFYWKKENGQPIKSLGKLKSYLEGNGQSLLFAMNGGMYLKDLSPQGLFIENGVVKKKANRVKKAYGNFYLQPNGIFYLTPDNQPIICTTPQFKNGTKAKYATQSGPMLVIDGKIHPKFTKGSSNTHIRNGVGILEDGRLIFAISKERVNLYDFASFFKEKGCKNALYLDGFVSRAYIPSKDWIQLDGNFGVIIAVVE